MEHKKQVDKSHYKFQRYFYKGRWMSYHYQLSELLSLTDVRSILEVGPGTSLVRHMLAEHAPEVSYKTLDLADDLEPDILGSVTNIPTEDNAYDVVCAFQVLEHLPYEEALSGLKEMLRVADKYVVVSIPYTAAELSFSLKIPFLPRGQWFVRIPFPVKHTFDGQHYWELGKKEYSPRRVRKDFSKIGRILKEYTPFENQHHRFYVIQGKQTVPSE